MYLNNNKKLIKISADIVSQTHSSAYPRIVVHFLNTHTSLVSTSSTLLGSVTSQWASFMQKQLDWLNLFQEELKPNK